MRAIRQQQDHIMRLMNIQDKLLNQDKYIRNFCEQQHRLIANLQPPLVAQQLAMQSLQKRQGQLLGAMGGALGEPRSSAGKPGLAQPQGVFAKVEEPPMPLPHIPPPGQLPIITVPGESALGSYVGAGDGSAGRGYRGVQLNHKPYHSPPPMALFSGEPASLGGIKPFPQHDPEADAKALRKAMKVCWRGQGGGEMRHGFAKFLANWTQHTHVNVRQSGLGHRRSEGHPDHWHARQRAAPVDCTGLQFSLQARPRCVEGRGGHRSGGLSKSPNAALPSLSRGSPLGDLWKLQDATDGSHDAHGRV